jgi:GDP-L-fucose synthase
MAIDLTQLRGSTVRVYGACGFWGRHVVVKLRELGANVECITRQISKTLPDTACSAILSDVDYVINLAGFNGGIAFGEQHAFSIFHTNTEIPFRILDTAIYCGFTGKIIMPIASCAYPTGQSQLPETSLLDGEPHPTVMAHAHAKRNVQLACKFANQEFGIRAITVCPPTLFGPGDRFEPERSKVMAAMIRRFADAADNNDHEVQCWGTGQAKRQYLFVEDATNLLLQAMLSYEDSSLPLNIGSSVELTVRETAEKVASLCGYKGVIRWDSSKSDGQLLKSLQFSRMNELLGEQSFTDFDEALLKTIAYYREARDKGTLR